MGIETSTVGGATVTVLGQVATVEITAVSGEGYAWSPTNAEDPLTFLDGAPYVMRVLDATDADDDLRFWEVFVYNNGGGSGAGWGHLGFNFDASTGDITAYWREPDFTYHVLDTAAFDPVNMAYMRFSRSGADVTYETSDDGVGWNFFATLDGTANSLDFEIASGVQADLFSSVDAVVPYTMEFEFIAVSGTAPPAESITATLGGEGGVESHLTYELGDRISATFDERWASGLHIGNARPTIGVQVRRGRFNRAHRPWFGDDVYARIAGVSDSNPWQAFWTPAEPYVNVPNVLSFERARSFDQDGFSTATLVIENIISVAHIDPDPEDDDLATHHTTHRGYLAPVRGYVGPGRTALEDEHGDEVEPNEWFDVLRRNAQITVHLGYGDQVVKRFTGLVDDVDWRSRPDQIKVTLRCFGGKTLADTRMFGWSKEPEIRDPVVFIDEDDAQQISTVATSTSSSGFRNSNHKPDNVTDGDGNTSWQSDVSDVTNFTEWVEITVPQGRYSDFVLNPEFADQEFYVSIFPENLAGAVAPSLDGVDIPDGEWYDASLGDVPGVNGGIPYVLFTSAISLPGRVVVDLGGEFRMGAGSKIRLSVRNLFEIDTDEFVAGVVSFVGRKRSLVEEAVSQQWVRVQDVADVVKCILRWAGFLEWEIESTGVSLSKRLVISRGMTYREVIGLCEEAVGYEFFVGDPTEDDRSIGVPVFRQSQIVTNADPVLTVTDDLLLSDVEPKISDAPLAYIIRVRGRESREGVKLGADRTKRLQFTLRPPWSGAVHSETWERNGGIHKRVIHTNPLFKTMDDCRFAAYYIALREAIESGQAVAQIPAHPAVQPDVHVELRDLGTGLTTRLSVREERETFQAGEETLWQATFSGAIVDVPNVQDMVEIINDAVPRA